MASRRKQRFEAFRSRDRRGLVGLSSDHIRCALTLFEAALNDRKGESWREKDNHYTPHALGCVTMISSAFEAWLNEILAWENVAQTGHADLAERPIVEKYRRLCELDGGSADAVLSDLDLLIEVRNESVHHLPTTFAEGDVPPWLADLILRDLLVKSGGEPEFQFVQRFPSFKLALWAVGVTEACVQHLLTQTKAERAVWAGLTAGNFSLYRSVFQEGTLEQIDKAFGLALHDADQPPAHP